MSTWQQAHLEGEIAQIKAGIRSVVLKLRESRFKNIEKRHREKMIDVETTSLAATDLDKYYKALDAVCGLRVCA